MTDETRPGEMVSGPDHTAESGTTPAVGPVLRPGWTIASVLLLVPVLALLLWPPSVEHRLTALDAPERALERIVGRTMDLHEAVARRGPWEAGLYATLGVTSPDDQDQAIAWYEELAGQSAEPSVELELAILDAETRRIEPLRRRLSEWSARDGLWPRAAALLEQTYLSSDGWTLDPRALAAVYGWLNEGWFRDRLDIAMERARGAADAEAWATARLVARASAILARVQLIVAAMAITLVCGIIALIAAVRARRRESAFLIGTAPLPPPWSGRQGLAVLARAAALSALIGAGLLVLPAGAEGVLRGAELVLGGIIALPLVVLGYRYLLRPSDIRFADGLGFRLLPGGARRLGLAVPAVVALGLAGDWLIGIAVSAGGQTGHWTEWFDEALVFGGPVAVASGLMGAVVLAPLSEEIAFRGFLFAALRRWWGWPASAVVSGMAFAVLHGYGTAGFLSVAWSGCLWAWSYERTRSLWPAILAHAVSNLWASLIVLGLLR